MQHGALIAIEGIDGTGKSTQQKLLVEELRRRGHRVVATREPTDGPYGQKIRKLYIDRDAVSREEELELFLRDRKDHIERLIAPSLAAGKVVVTDRYFLSTAAYQGAAGFDPEEIMMQNEAFAPIPNLVLLLTLPPEQGVERIRHKRGEELNAFEQEESLKLVSVIFDKIKRDYITRIDGSADEEKVHEAIMCEVEKIL